MSAMSWLYWYYGKIAWNLLPCFGQLLSPTILISSPSFSLFLPRFLVLNNRKPLFPRFRMFALFLPPTSPRGVAIGQNSYPWGVDCPDTCFWNSIKPKNETNKKNSRVSLKIHTLVDQILLLFKQMTSYIIIENCDYWYESRIFCEAHYNITIFKIIIVVTWQYSK